MEKQLNKFDPFGLVVGILSVIVAIISLRNPLPTFGMVVFFAAVISIVRGIYKLVAVRPYIENNYWVTVNAILDILIGGLMLFNAKFGMLYVSIFFAIMFLMDSISMLNLAAIVGKFNRRYYWLEITLAVLGIVFGIILLVSPVLSAISISFMISLLFMTFGIGEIAHSI